MWLRRRIWNMPYRIIHTLSRICTELPYSHYFCPIILYTVWKPKLQRFHAFLGDSPMFHRVLRICYSEVPYDVPFSLSDSCFCLIRHQSRNHDTSTPYDTTAYLVPHLKLNSGIITSQETLKNLDKCIEICLQIWPPRVGRSNADTRLTPRYHIPRSNMISRRKASSS